MNSVAKHEEDSVLTCKMAIPSIVNTLNKIYILRAVYDTYATNYYNEHHVETFKIKFKVFFTVSKIN